MQTNQNHLGGSYLKPDGTLKQKVRCVLQARNGGTRRIEGKFGPQLELPIEIEGIQFVVCIPADKGDGLNLSQQFGPDLATWAGKAVQVGESELLNRIRVIPAE